eukprot:scaffold11403_cov93-Skeletonema_marinoi.AAC.1
MVAAGLSYCVFNLDAPDRMGVPRLPPKYATGGKKTYFRVGEVSLAYEYVPRELKRTRIKLH